MRWVGMVVVGAMAVGCGGDEPEQPEATPPPIASSPELVSPRGTLAASTAPLQWTAPGGWEAQPPSNPMRHTQYRVPGPGGDAEMVVSTFGRGQGGDPAANVQRWGGQFKQPEGGSPQEALKTETFDVSGIKVLFVETSGTYTPMAMGADDPADRPDHMLLGAIVEGSEGSWFFKLTGPVATVESQRQAFMDLLRSLRRSG
jgi:hypothetical protein